MIMLGNGYRMIQLTTEVTLPEYEIKDRNHPFDSYLEWYRLALLKDPNDYNRFCYIKALLGDMQFNRAWVYIEQCNPMNPVTQFFRSYTLLQQGDLKEGLTYRESRFKTSRYPLDIAAPRWDGKPTDKKIFIWQEGGYGDVIQYVRYFPQILERCPNASAVIDKSIFPLIELNFPENVMPKFSPYDFQGQCSMMSLPFLLGDFEIDKAPYLMVPQDLIDKWSIFRGRIGFVGMGNPAHSSDKLRSLTVEEIGRFVSNKDWCSLDPQVTGAANWLDTAGIIKNLDLVITVDTAIGHLAGALGKPVWVLMNKHHDWRWSHNWYDSMKIYKCKEHSVWEPVFQQIEQDLHYGKLRTTRNQEAPEASGSPRVADCGIADR